MQSARPGYSLFQSSLQPDYVDGQATHKPQKSKKHFLVGSLSASTAEDDNPIAPSAIVSVAQNNPTTDRFSQDAELAAA